MMKSDEQYQVPVWMRPLLHRHTRFRRQELAQDEINPDVLAMSGHIARRCSEQKRVRIPAMKVSEWGHLLRALEIERVCH